MVVRLDQEHLSSDGGALLLKAVDERLELTERLASWVDYPRQPGKVRHAMLVLLRQRIYGIASGYPGGNDAARRAQDRVHKLLREWSRSRGRGMQSTGECRLYPIDDADGDLDVDAADVKLVERALQTGS